MPISSMNEYLVDLDQKMLQALFVCHRNSRLPNFLYYLCLFCELSGHGVLWLVGTVLAILTAPDVYTKSLSIYVFLLLILDIVLVAPIKIFFKRPRPTMNEGKILFSVSNVDDYAFPSGHASRAVAVAVYLLPWIPTHLSAVLCMWAACVCLSRVLMGRHHPSDVVGGILAGLAVCWCTNKFHSILGQEKIWYLFV